MAMGIATRDESGEGPIGYGRALGRFGIIVLLDIACVIPLLIDYLSPLWDARRQAWHDKTAHSLVISVESKHEPTAGHGPAGRSLRARGGPRARRAPSTPRSTRCSTSAAASRPRAEFAAAALATAGPLRRRARRRRVVGPPGAARSSGPSPWHTTLEWELPVRASGSSAAGSTPSVNCLDRHVAAGNGDRVAIHWVGEPEGDTLDLTYAELLAGCARRPTPSSRSGVTRGRPRRDLPAHDPRGRRGDARLRADRRAALGHLRRLLGRGARDRILDADARFVITADGGYRRGAVEPAQAPRRRGAGEAARTCAASSSCAGPPATSAGSRAGTTGGTTSSTASRPTHAGAGVRRRAPAVPHVHVAGRRPSPRASSTRPAATSRTSSTTHRYVFDLQARHRRRAGPPPTSAG